MAVRGTLNDLPLLGSADVRWSFTDGVKPFESEFDMRPSDAAQLLNGPIAPVTLVLSDGDAQTVTIKGLYVLMAGVGPNPHISRVLVVDRRWFFSHAHVVRHINVRRTLGPKRQRVPDVPPELQPLVPNVSYAPFSLRNGQPWKASEVLEDVLAQVVRVEGLATGGGGTWFIDPQVGARLDNLPIENLELDHSGDMALNRVLSYLPEAAMKVDPNGRIVIYSRASGAERQIIQDAGAESIGKGHVEWITNQRVRPKEIHVLFTREHEVRFDFTEQDTETFSPDERYMQNVLSVPDYQLRPAGAVGQAAQTVPWAQGTWIPFPDALDAWGAPPFMGHLTSAGAWFVAIRRNMVPTMDLWTGIRLNGDLDPDADWMSRIGAIQTHYRRTFRINSRWMARILQLKASKVATIDPVSGTRAPALVYADHARMATQRTIRQELKSGGRVTLAMNIQSYPTSPNGDIDSSARAAPAEVKIADHDQGIVSLNFLPDIYRNHEVILPSLVQNLPSVDIDDVNLAIAWNARSSRYDSPQLSGNHKVAVILTAVPAGSNSPKAQQLHRVVRKPKDVAGMLPPAYQAGLSTAFGPIMEVRINPTIETARVTWLDNRAADIEAAFGTTEAQFNLDDLIINDTKDSNGAGSLDAIATAVAARTYAMFADREKGSKTVRLFPRAEPDGFLQSVTHSIAAGTGAAETILELPGQTEQIDLFSLLPDSTRRIVLRLAPSPGGAAG